MKDLIMYLECRIEALDCLIELHKSKTGDYLIMERAVCCIQLDKLKLRQRKS